MNKKNSSLFALSFLLAIIAISYFSMMPQLGIESEIPLNEFSTKRAFEKVEALSKKPHYIGSQNHEQVAQYLQHELHKLGLKTSLQEGFTLTDWGNLVYSKNILARIKGSNSSKALLLLTHYDSAPHSSSYGASDAGSGVATILESVRAFLHSKKGHKNDIIILFSDAEELGLNGATLFVTQHQWAKQIGLALNFEARGTSGPSYMLMETNKGNAGLVNEFANTKATFPVSNSLMYSIYKMLPNDTDLTIFRKKGNIQGFNFAFIDGHYNYHTAQDDSIHLSKNSLAHQGTYLTALLNYFSNADLSKTQSSQDEVYFTVPFTFIHYPFDWVQPMLYIAIGLFIIILFIGIAKRILNLKTVVKGFIPFLIALILSGGITFFGWKGIQILYPQYEDLLNGFTYNGHDYIVAFVFLALAIAMTSYHYFSAKKVTMSNYVAPIFFWLLINGAIAFYLEGAGFLILPLYFSLILFGFFILTQRTNRWFNLILSIPALLIIGPFIYMFPVGLGLKILFGSVILTVLTFGLLLPVLGTFAKKGQWAMVFILISIGFFVKAHLNSGYEKGKAKSNSLVYLYDSNVQKAYWLTYDTNLDDWTKKYLGSHPKKANLEEEIPLFSKYNSAFTYTAEATLKAVPTSTIIFSKDSIEGNLRHLKIKITPNRKVNRYDIFANEKMDFYHFKTNGVSQLEQTGNMMNRNGMRILSYYVVNNQPLEMEFTLNRATVFDMQLLESSFDLLQNPLFEINPRAPWMMPTPFVLTDAICVKQTIKPKQTITETPTVAIPTTIQTKL
ncbi:M28 family peptidase [Flavobacterium sp.]|uniref:M28 family peptidase n=1 Tax=Flavobacterium sp. TaxID=239 RepID=UPI003C3DF6F6